MHPRRCLLFQRVADGLQMLLDVVGQSCTKYLFYLLAQRQMAGIVYRMTWRLSKVVKDTRVSTWIMLQLEHESFRIKEKDVVDYFRNSESPVCTALRHQMLSEVAERLSRRRSWSWPPCQM